MHPTFLARLEDPAVRTVLLCGCGGGFDFVHAFLLYPDLLRWGKTVVVASHSFGDPEALPNDAPVVYEAPHAHARLATATTRAPRAYAPEVHVCSFLDARFPAAAPHAVYATYARAFTVPSLARFYAHLAERHGIDAVVLVDGGSDALMAGDEAGLGDPVEDAVSVQAVARLEEVPLRILVSAGLGADRLNGVSDAATLRAVAELTRAGGFLGALAVEPGGEAARFYRDLLAHIGERQTSRSNVANAIRDAIAGQYGVAAEGERPSDRTSADRVYLWPLMAVLWAFDVEAVAARALGRAWLEGARTPAECHAAFRAGRLALGARRREEERLPEPVPWPFAPLYDPR